MNLDFTNINKRYLFRATFKELSLDSEWSKTKQDNVWKPVIGLSDIYCRNPDTGYFEFVGDTARISYTKMAAELGQLVCGEQIEFKARYVGGGYLATSLGKLMNPTKLRIVKPLTKKRYPVPRSEYLRVGYVMELNQDKYSNPATYDQEIVADYDEWCNTIAYKKNSAADQSNAES